jgi:hypothetical protein
MIQPNSLSWLGYGNGGRRQPESRRSAELIDTLSALRPVTRPTVMYPARPTASTVASPVPHETNAMALSAIATTDRERRCGCDVDRTTNTVTNTQRSGRMQVRRHGVDRM